MPEIKSSSAETSPLKAILLAGLVAGCLDITAAIVILAKMNATGVLKYIASAFFGKAAFEGGAWMAACGLLMHFTIATSFAALYYFVYPFIPFLRKQKIISGLLYGVVVWMIMSLVLVPLTRVSLAPFKWDRALLNMGILMVMIGLPISLIIHHYYSKNSFAKKNR